MPTHPRDHARLLVYSCADGSLTDSVFYKLDEFLPKSSTIVLNDSKVENCRWLFNDRKIEIFVLEKNDPQTVRALVRPGRKFQIGRTIQLTDWLNVETTAIDHEGIRTLKLSVKHDDKRLKPYEHIPLPPYIDQNDKLSDEYQTVYAKPLGSLAAPTAGLHFTRALLENLAKAHEIEKVTLHVGLGTFAKLTDENLKLGRLHEEFFEIPDKTFEKLLKAQHVTAVGTTSARTLESAFGLSKTSGFTDIFIRPGYKFKRVNGLVTNFHLPGTSLLMLVAAFLADKKGLNESEAAAELIRIYKHAIAKQYRFYSFGDTMLLF